MPPLVRPLPQFGSAKNPAEYEEIEIPSDVIIGATEATARVLLKAIQVEEARSYTPCGYCGSCVSVLWRDGQQEGISKSRNGILWLGKTFLNTPRRTWTGWGLGCRGSAKDMYI